MISVNALIYQLVPIIPLARFVTEIADEPLHVGDAHAERRARLAHHIFLNHDAPQIVRAVFQRNLPDLQPRDFLGNAITEGDIGELFGGRLDRIHPPVRRPTTSSPDTFSRAYSTAPALSASS